MPITISAPDLTITTATAPSSAIEGQAISVSWTVQNIGSVVAPGDWYDAIFLGSSPIFKDSSDTLVDSFYQGDQSPLAAGASYTDNESITLPPATTGSEYLIFVTNYEGVEGSLYDSYDIQGETNYTNNTFAVPITVTAPDLTITTATAPSSAILSSSIKVSWTVKNIGSVTAPGDWYDAVYIGSSPTFNADNDTFVTDFSESKQSPLAAGSSYTDSESITLPATAATGSEYLIFVTNYDAVESDPYDLSYEQGETDYANNSFAVPITVYGARPDDHDGHRAFFGDLEFIDRRVLDGAEHRQRRGRRRLVRRGLHRQFAYL